MSTASVYLSGQCEILVRMDRIGASDSIRASWIDPRDGGRRPIGTFQCADVEQFATPEGWADAPLPLEAE